MLNVKIYKMSLANKIIFPSLVLVCGAVDLVAQSSLITQDSTQSFFEQGLDLLGRGDSIQALSVWMQEWNLKSHNANHDIDPRCAVYFMNVVSKQELTKFYRLASAFYISSLESRLFDSYVSYFSKDAELLSKVLDKDKVALTPSNLSSIIQEINPDPFAAYNRGLLEFFIRKHLADSLIKDTKWDDARKITVLKYGEPKRRISATYTINRPNLQQLLTPVLGGYENLSLYMKYFENELNAILIPYEIWKYENDEFLFFKSQSSIFENIPISQLIPSKLKRAPTASTILTEIPRVVPAFFVLLDLADHLSAQSEQMLALFIEYDFKYVESITRSGSANSRYMEETMFATSKAREQHFKTAITRVGNTINTNENVKLYSRFKSYTFARDTLSATRTLILIKLDSLSFQDTNYANANVREIFNNIKVDTDNVSDSVSTFSSSENAKFFGISRFSELDDTILTEFRANFFVELPDSTSAKNTKISIKNEKLAIENRKISISNSRVSLSDVVIGTEKSDAKFSLFSFLPSIDNTLPEGANMRIYFEVYHSDLASSDKEDLQVSLEISPNSIFQKIRRIRNTKTILNFSPEHIITPFELEIESTQMRPGKYQLTVFVDDEKSQSDAQAVQRVSFEVFPVKGKGKDEKN